MWSLFLRFAFVRLELLAGCRRFLWRVKKIFLSLSLDGLSMGMIMLVDRVGFVVIRWDGIWTLERNPYSIDTHFLYFVSQVGENSMYVALNGLIAVVVDGRNGQILHFDSQWIHHIIFRSKRLRFMLRLMEVSKSRWFGYGRLILLRLLIKIRIFWDCPSLVIFVQVFSKIQELPFT